MQVITYKFELKPSTMQERKFAVFIGQSRFVWNQLLALIQEKRKLGEKVSISPFGLTYLITELKAKFEWLSEAHVHTLQESAKNLANAFKRWFSWLKTKKGRKVGAPRFKSKRDANQSFRYKSGIKVDGNKVWLPKIGWVRYRNSRDVIGKIKTASVKKSPTGKWFVSISCEREFNHLPVVDSVVGVDVGLSHFATLNDGTKIDNPRWFRRGQRKLKHLQQSLSRKVKGSSNRQKAKLAVAIQHERVTNQRRDFQHKLSTKLINENQVIGVESLSLAGLMKTRLAKSFGDAGLGAFLGMLKYKAEWYGRTVVEADRFYPSSKTCSECEEKNESLQLSDRIWQCACGVTHDRDINAAINLRNVAVGYIETLNACGDSVSRGVIHATV
jgi:putative transposase